MQFRDILKLFRDTSFTESNKGIRFERLMKSWLLTDPKYSNLMNVWLWEEFPSKADLGGKDIGIDLVAETDNGDFWAIQCKFYADTTAIDKPEVDSFLATSSKTFKHPETMETTRFSQRVWISTTTKWSSNAQEAIENQTPPFIRINPAELDESPVNWKELLEGKTGKGARIEKKTPRPDQEEAINLAHQHFSIEKNERGKMIMACGTGKTFSSLKIVEKETGGKGTVLFLVPSIALLNQSLNDWFGDSEEEIKAICICSDNQANRKMGADPDTTSIVDLALPASTNAKSIVEQFKFHQKRDGLLVVFSTYQSIDVISQAQKQLKKELGDKAIFDFIVCDEAHRTTGFKERDRDESSFVKVHDNKNIEAKHRLYMTATPRMYGDSAKVKASEEETTLWDMANEDIYGKEFYHIGFGKAVELGLLSDYKVLVLTIDENAIPENLQSLIRDKEKKEITADSMSKLIGCINGLSKRLKDDKENITETDPKPMRRAVAFCQTIKNSKEQERLLTDVSELYKQELPAEKKEGLVSIEAKHIDGTMGAGIRGEMVSWLREDFDDPNECRVLTNVRCLSEGVNVPALDAVLFLSARNSQIDVVQSVGRVMRRAEGKKYGYIIIPVVVPADVEPEVALEDNDRFRVVWSVLQALRSHDDRFNATINKIELNKSKPPQISHTHIGGEDLFGSDNDSGANAEQKIELEKQLNLRFEGLNGALYAKMVQKVGDKHYWENWAKDVGIIAQNFISRINGLIEKNEEHKQAFKQFLGGLQANINPSVTKEEAIEMLAQHIITRPVFDALFQDYSFAKSNAVSQSMQKMLNLLDQESLEKETETLQKFYNSVQMRAHDIDNAAAKQHILKELYDKFFQLAFPLTAAKLGIVYTPIECVDFIIHSVNDVLKKEFGRSISDENIHILDPFTGTGTFIVRLLQSGLINKEDLIRKYTKELHANEIVLLAYYVAAVNIENAFYELNNNTYEDFRNICLTDTFQLGEETAKDGEINYAEFFPINTENVENQKKAPIRVIIGNPPYSVGQASANDNSQNQSYKALEAKIEKEYVQNSKASLNKSAYDSYIKAFRWASDRLVENEGGIIAFISNASWLDANGLDGFRKRIEEEFSAIYVFNLRGNQRTSGELSRKEGGKIFDSGSRTPIAITLLVKDPSKKNKKATIHYRDIGDYLNRKEKLSMIKDYKTILSPKMKLDSILPNEHGDWINQRSDLFTTYIPLAPKKRFEVKSQSWFMAQATGVSTNRDPWVYNFSRIKLESNMQSMIDSYNKEREKLKEGKELDLNPTKISWTRALRRNAENNIPHEYNNKEIRMGLYRPFMKSPLYYHRPFIESPGVWSKLYPSQEHINKVICVSGVSSSKGFSCVISDSISDLQVLFNGQTFPLYYYDENKNEQKTLFDNSKEKYIRRDGVSDWILKQVRGRFSGARNLTKEHIFYYVYGILHSQQYRDTFEADLSKSLPHIPIVDTVEDFMAFYKAGKELAELHLNYEDVPPYEGVTIKGEESKNFEVQKMKFPKRDEKDTIIYNSKIRIEGIPEEAYDYVVNGKSAIEWIMERYAVTTDKRTGITNDANDWAREQGKPRYILDLLLSIINVSVQTMEIVKNLPKLDLEE